MSSNDMPELGSKISLISKADIRYEGKLFTVDPQDCTIALANVRSFGTEDRVTDHPVPAQNQVYDYILFRATDIKDISVIPSPPTLYDPAIVQLSVPPSIAPGAQYQSGFSHPVLGQIGDNRPQGFNPMQSGLNPPIHRPQPPKKLLPDLMSIKGSVADMLSVGSRSSTPGGRKISFSDQSTQSTQPPIKQASPPRRSPPHQSNHQPSHQPNRNSDFQPMPSRDFHQQHRNDYQYRSNNQQQRNMQQRYNNRGDMQQQLQQHQKRYLMHSQQQQQQNNRGWMGGNGMPLGQRGGGMQRGGRGRPRQQQFHQGGNTGQPRPRPQKQPLKFDSDYDFDKANTEFEELRHTLASQLKISGEGSNNTEAGGVAAPAAAAPLAPAPTDDKKDDSGNETAVGDCEPEDESQPAYDKTKSFFDNISCEAIERSKGRSQRTDWRKELKLNSETFGVPVARRYYNPRGRGGYYRGSWGMPMHQYKPRQQNNIEAKA